jgi:hypothetical protein
MNTDKGGARETRPLQRLAPRLFDDRSEILRYAQDNACHSAQPEGKAMGTSQQELAVTLPSRAISRGRMAASG